MFLYHIMRKIRKSIVTLYPFNLFKFTDIEKENHTISHDLFFVCPLICTSETYLHGLLP